MVTVQSTQLQSGEFKVYNLTVANDHTYLAEGVLTHNVTCRVFQVVDGEGRLHELVTTPDGKRLLGELIDGSVLVLVRDLTIHLEKGLEKV